MVFKLNTDFEQQEALDYRPGQRVELKQRPGFTDIIAEYDPMMVPPISLVNDPQPRYPEELVLLTKPGMEVGWFKTGTRRQVRASIFQSRSRATHKVSVLR